MARWLIPLLCLSLLCACQTPPRPGTTSASRTPEPTVAKKETGLSSKKLSFPTLGDQSFQVDAVWEQANGPDMDLLLKTATGQKIGDLSVAQESRTYQAKELAGLLPKEAVAVGETWSIEPKTTAKILNQFHSQVLPKMNMDGSGAHGLLRASSDDFLNIQLRLHAQFVVTEGVYFTPAEFSGHLILDRKKNEIAYLSLAVPTRHAKNLAYEMHVGEFLVGLDFVPKMELEGGDSAALELAWSEEIDSDTAEATLLKQFYEHKKIDWVPLEQAAARAQELDRPIFAVVIAGALDDQSC